MNSIELAEKLLKERQTNSDKIKARFHADIKAVESQLESLEEKGRDLTSQGNLTEYKENEKAIRSLQEDLAFYKSGLERAEQTGLVTMEEYTDSYKAISEELTQDAEKLKNEFLKFADKYMKKIEEFDMKANQGAYACEGLSTGQPYKHNHNFILESKIFPIFSVCKTLHAEMIRLK